MPEIYRFALHKFKSSNDSMILRYFVNSSVPVELIKYYSSTISTLKGYP